MKKYFTLLLFIVAFGIIYIWKYVGQRNFFKDEVQRNLYGIITNKLREQTNNPKAYKIQINDSLWLRLDFNLIDEVAKGDTLIKKSGEKIYTYYSKSKIVKYKFAEPHFFDFFNTKEHGFIDITNR